MAALSFRDTCGVLFLVLVSTETEVHSSQGFEGSDHCPVRRDIRHACFEQATA